MSPARTSTPVADTDRALDLIREAEDAIATGRPDSAVCRLLEAANLAVGLVPAGHPVRGADADHPTTHGCYLGRTPEAS